MAIIKATDLAGTLIAGTNVTVQDLIDALCDALDGTQDHDIANMTGEGHHVDLIIRTRAAVKPFWNVN